MQLTLNTLFNDSLVIKAVIDRVNQIELDTVYWKRHLKFQQTNSRLFKTYLGAVTGVKMGSVIDRNSGKPIRTRKSLGSGVGEVAFLGNSYQLDNDRLDNIQSLIDKFNGAGEGQPAVMNEIIEFLADDLRQVTLAPHKRMDYIVGQLRSTGSATVNYSNNEDGVELQTLTLPVVKYTPDSSNADKIVAYIKEKVEALAPTVGRFAVMEMTRTTFNTRIVASDEFKDIYKMVLGSSEIAVNQGLITDAMANNLLTGIGLPAIRIVEEYLLQEDGTPVNAFADDRIAFYQSDDLGKMMWHTPYEATDPVPTKTYNNLEGGHFISTQRTDEGRFIEYGAEWIPNFTAPNKIMIIDCSDLS